MSYFSEQQHASIQIKTQNLKHDHEMAKVLIRAGGIQEVKNMIVALRELSKSYKTDYDTSKSYVSKAESKELAHHYDVEATHYFILSYLHRSTASHIESELQDEGHDVD